MKKQSISNSHAVVDFFWNHVRQYPRLLGGVLFAVPLTVLINDYLPSLIAASVLSKLSQHHYSADVLKSFGPQLVLFAVLTLSGMLTWRIVDFFVWRLEGNVQRDLARQVFDHMISESADFHANNFSGSLVSQNSKLLGGYVRIADATIFQLLPLTVGMVFATLILLPRAPLFVDVLLLFTVIYIIAAFFVSRPTQKLSAEHAASESRQTGYLADAIGNVMAIKSFARGNFERQRYSAVTDKTYNHLAKFARGIRRQHNVMGTINRTISALSLTLAVFSVTRYHANIGTVFLILSYTGTIVGQLFVFSNNTLRNYSRSIGDSSDLVQILHQQPSIVDPFTPESSRIRKGTIDFNNVSFTHDGSDDALFSSFNVHIKHGEKIGLVGHSGSGKSTFTRLLQRFSDIDDGEILIDGQNIIHITQDDLHAQIAYVPQDSLLFHRSIMENIGYGKLDASLDEIKLAAKHANAAEFIVQLPQGYETLVGERGVKLSGGQRQRVAIARAMLKNAPILVLDEATSALDSESEVLIQEALWRLMEGRTAIVIAHRLSTIQKMDRIIVLDEGKISEQGSHKELLANNGTYATLWAHQSGGFIED